MAKGGKGFADKTSKAGKIAKKTCPVCGEPIDYVKHVTTVSDADNKSMRFTEKMVAVCKCNRDQIYK
jgi:hypothetical protein